DELVKVEKHLLDVTEAMISDAPHVVRDVKRHYRVTMRGLTGCAVPGCCPARRPIDCQTFCCDSAHSVCGDDGSCGRATTTTTIPGPGGSGWCDPIGVGTCVACSSDADCVPFLGSAGRCTFHCNPGGANPCPSSCP